MIDLDVIQHDFASLSGANLFDKLCDAIWFTELRARSLEVARIREERSSTIYRRRESRSQKARREVLRATPAAWRRCVRCRASFVADALRVRDHRDKLCADCSAPVNPGIIAKAAALGIGSCTLAYRLRVGIDPSKPVGAAKYEFNGEALPLREWSKRSGVPVQTIRRRLKESWPLDRAIFTPPR